MRRMRFIHGVICMAVTILFVPAAWPDETAPLPFRSLRDNAPRGRPKPTAPTPFSGYPDAPAFSVVPRVDQL